MSWEGNLEVETREDLKFRIAKHDLNNLISTVERIRRIIVVKTVEERIEDSCGLLEKPKSSNIEAMSFWIMPQEVCDCLSCRRRRSCCSHCKSYRRLVIRVCINKRGSICCADRFEDR